MNKTMVCCLIVSLLGLAFFTGQAVWHYVHPPLWRSPFGLVTADEAEPPPWVDAQ